MEAIDFDTVVTCTNARRLLERRSGSTFQWYAARAVFIYFNKLSDFKRAQHVLVVLYHVIFRIDSGFRGAFCVFSSHSVRFLLKTLHVDHVGIKNVLCVGSLHDVLLFILV